MNSDLITRLTTASRGSPELSAEVLTVLTEYEHVAMDSHVIRLFPPRGRAKGASVRTISITESLDAAWEMAVAAGYNITLYRYPSGCSCSLIHMTIDQMGSKWACTPALALCAAMVGRQQGEANG